MPDPVPTTPAVTPAAADPMKPTATTQPVHVITIPLTPEQQAHLHSITGEKVEHLRVGVQDLADISDLMIN